MNRKLKLALAALLGFSAACSSVKNAPKQEGGQKQEADSLGGRHGNGPRRIIVMYGVRPPVPVESENAVRVSPGSELDPVMEVAGPDSLPSGPVEPATTSGLDPVVEQPVEE